MANIEAFEQHAEWYEQWFDRHSGVYESEFKIMGRDMKHGILALFALAAIALASGCNSLDK